MHAYDRTKARIRAARLAKGLTQRRLGAAIGCARETIANVELGTTLPSLETIVRMAHALDCSIDDLVDSREIVHGRS